MALPFTHVHLPSRFAGHEHGAWLRSRSGQWAGLRDEFRSARGYTVPDWLFDGAHRVQDEAAYLIGPDCNITPTRSPAIRRGAVVVVLESPHKDEFDGPGGCASARFETCTSAGTSRPRVLTCCAPRRSRWEPTLRADS